MFEINKRNSRSHGIRKNGNVKRKSKQCITIQDLNNTFTTEGRHKFYIRLCSLSLKNLVSLSEVADTVILRSDPLYNVARFINKYSFHKLRPHIDEHSNHKRSFLKLLFSNKAMDLLNLPSIFNHKNVVSQIPDYFENKEPPMICYKYNKPIRGMIFNYNKTTRDDAHNLITSCECNQSEFCYKPAGHIVTGNLDVLTSRELRDLCKKGPKYRLPAPINFESCRYNIAESINEYVKKWCKRENTDPTALSNWKKQIFSQIDNKISWYLLNPKLLSKKPKYSYNELKHDLQHVHNKFVLTPADKASNNIVVI